MVYCICASHVAVESGRLLHSAKLRIGGERIVRRWMVSVGCNNIRWIKPGADICGTGVSSVLL
jgi:hypothetical protein